MRYWPQKPPLGVPVNWGDPLARGLVGCWLMNEGGGNIVNDLSGNRIRGTIVNAIWSKGQFGPALSFDGTGDNIATTIISQTDSLAAMTVGVWCYPLSTTNYRFAISKDTAFGIGVRDYDGYRWSLISTGGSTGTAGKSVGTVEYNTWQFLCVRFNGSVAELIKNGVILDSVPATGTTKIETDYMGIGVFRQANTDYYNWNGLISHVQLWNRALSASEVQQLYMTPFRMFQESF